METEVVTMQLPVKLNEIEVSLKAQELATAEAVLGEKERQLNSFVEAAKGTKKQYETEILDARANVGGLARIVRERAEERAVPVMEECDYEKGAVDTYRTDTHERISTRGMTPEERQRSLFEEKRRAGKKPS